MVTTTNLVSYYKLDETSGTTASDSHGSNDGTIVGATPTTAGKINGARDFENANADTIKLIGLPTISSENGLSVQFWIKPESFGGLGVYNIILDSGNSNRFYLSISESIAGADLHFYVGKTAGSFGTDLDSGVWTHLVYTIDEKTIKLYKNGVQYGGDKTINSYAILNSADTKYLGSRYSGGSTDNSYDGLMDEVGIWSRALTATEVSELYNSGNGLAYPFSTTTLTNMKINIGDTFKTVSELKINIGDVWKTVTSVKQNIGDSWKTVF